jgi:predicted ATP-grasp superfamily ATP-dependent carboligase
VQQRLYRGRCYNNDAIDPTLTAYKDKKAAILATMSEVDMASKRARKEMTDFIESFYKGIDSERRVTSNLRKRCI